MTAALKSTKNLTAYDGGGGASTPNAETGKVTLDVDSHYFAIPVAEDGTVMSIHILTDGTIAGTFTIETSNFPKYRGDAGGAGGTDVSDYNETVGNWVTEDDSNAYIATVGTGWTVTNMSMAKTAGAGAAMIHLGNLGSLRVRLKAAITTGGDVRVVAYGKV